MSNITAQMVKELRDRTGAGMMECKKALTASTGDMDGQTCGELNNLVFQGTRRTHRLSAGPVQRIQDKAHGFWREVLVQE